MDLRTNLGRILPVVAYVRTVKTSSGARAVQIVHGSRRGSRNIEHLGSAHDEAELEALKAAARQRLAAGQGELELGLAAAARSGAPLEITASRMGHLWDALGRAYDALGFDAAAGGDEVFRALTLARIIEPTSKLDSLRVLAEAGVKPPSYRTVERRLPGYGKEAWRSGLAASCARHAALGPASLVLYDVSVRHEALVVRAEVRDHRRGSCRSGSREAEGSLPGETPGWAGSSPDKAVAGQHCQMV